MRHKNKGIGLVLGAALLLSPPAAGAAKGKDFVAVLYSTYDGADASAMRTALDAALEDTGIAYRDYDGKNSPEVQEEQAADAAAQGAGVLAVSLVDSASDDAAEKILELADGRLVIFFNCSAGADVAADDSPCIWVSTDYGDAGHVLGEMIGSFLVKNYDAADLNGDGKISYVMFRGQEDSAEKDNAEKAGTEKAGAEKTGDARYCLDDADSVLREAGRQPLSFYDETGDRQYLEEEQGAERAEAAAEDMRAILSECSESGQNMPELVIADHDDVALAASAVLRDTGISVPVFGAGGSDEARDAVAAGSLTGTVGRDEEELADAIAIISGNFITGAGLLEGISEEMTEDAQHVSIPCKPICAG